MIYNAYELLAMLRHLTLWGVDDDGDLEWCGTDAQWRLARDEIAYHEIFAE